MPKLKRLLWDSNQFLQIAFKYDFEDEVVKIINNFLYFASLEEI